MLTGCFPGASQLPVTGETLKTAVSEVLPEATVVQLDINNVLKFTSATQRIPKSDVTPKAPKWEYLVGPGDILEITVWSIHELNRPQQSQGLPASGTVVQADGSIFFPYVGLMTVDGASVPTIRDTLATKLKNYFPDPQVEVRVIDFNARSALVTGAVDAPLRYPLGASPTHLVDIIGKAQLDRGNANTTQITLRRGKKSYSINLDAYVEDGHISSNPMILDGDNIFIPTQDPEEVFVLGQVRKASSVDITNRDISLTQILSEAGGVNIRDADARGVFVFRRSKDAMTVFQLDVSNPSSYLIGTRFALIDEDVVFVTTDPVSRWNRVISDLLPSVNLLGTANDL